MKGALESRREKVETGKGKGKKEKEKEKGLDGRISIGLSGGFK